MLRGDTFLLQVRGNRLCWLGGMFGSGKTALAVRLGYEFVRRGYARHIVTNFPCVLSTPIDQIEARDCFIILDEAGVFLSAAEFDNVSAFLRKTNLYIMLSSQQRVPSKAATLNIQRTWNGYAFGVPFWRYEAVLDYMRLKDKSTLMWWNPAEVFGLYDTEAAVGDDGGIGDWLVRSIPRKTVRGGDVDELRGVVADFATAAEGLAGALSVSSDKGRRRRR